VIRFVITDRNICAFAVPPKEGQRPFLGATALNGSLRLLRCN
jgi:hypothetical protein